MLRRAACIITGTQKLASISVIVMRRQANGGSGGIQENKRCSLFHGSRLLTVLLVISMIDVATSQKKMGTLDQGIRSPRNAKTTSKPSTRSSRVCNLKNCHTIASIIKNSMNLVVDPCDDFYDFACGRGPTVYPWKCGSPFVRRTLQMETIRVNGASPKVERMPSDFYKSCMNSTAIENLGAAPLKERISELGGWDMSGDWDEDKWDFKEKLLSIEKIVGGFVPLFWSHIEEDSKDNTKKAIWMVQSGPALSEEEYRNLSSKTILGYRQLIIDVVVLLGGNPNTTAQKADEIIRFEAQLANASLTVNNSKEVEITLGQLQREVPEFNWSDHFNKLFAPYIMPKSERISVPLPYLKEAMKVIQNTSKKSILANYMVWYVIQNEIKWLSTPFRNALLKYKQAPMGTLSYGQRLKKCISETTQLEYFDDIVSVACVNAHQKLFVGQIRQAKRIVKDMIAAFKENINALTWIDNATRREALQKIDAMRVKLGFPDWMLNSTRTAEKFKKYEGITIGSETYFKNQVSMFKMLKQRILKDYKKTIDEESWGLSILDKNAGYGQTSNTMTFPLAILQHPILFPTKFVRGYNFGRFGSYIGHELMHGFSISGRVYDKNGISRNWWTNTSLQEFNKRVKCYEKQYSTYKIGGKWPVNGKDTANENIADDGSLKIVLKAYYNWAKQNPSETWMLPGLNFTNEQLLYIGFAQDYCSSDTPRRRYLKTLGSTYADEKFRIIGPLTNSCEFANAFKCKKHSPMNPVNKCHLWSKEGPLM